MNNIISSVLSVAVLFSACVTCLARSDRPVETHPEVWYSTINENTVETSESVVHEEEPVKSDLQVVSGDSEVVCKVRAGGAPSKLQKALTGVGIGSAGILLTMALGLLLFL